MEKEITNGTLIGILLIGLFVLIGLSFGIYRIAKDTANYIQQQEVSIEPTIEDIQATAKQKLPEILLIVAGYSLVSVSIARKKYIRKDVVRTFESVEDYVTYCNNNCRNLKEVPRRLHSKDRLIALYDAKDLSLWEYLVKPYKSIDTDKVISTEVGKEIELRGLVESSGYYYKIGNHYIHKDYLIADIGTEANFKIYALHKNLTLLPDRVIVNACELEI